MISSRQASGFSLQARWRSMGFALRGLRTLVATQHNAWIHAAATAAVVVAGVSARLTASEWCCIALAVAMVWAAEAFNTALEFLCDVVSPGFHPLVRNAKDIAAGAVLVAALGASIVGVLILGPRL